MDFGFKLVLLDEGDYATLYSFQKAGAEKTELERFWATDAVQKAPDCDNLRVRLYQEVLDEHNFNHYKCFQGPDRWFRDEGNATDPEGVHAEALCASIPAKDKKHLPKPYPRLRLYCFRMRKILVAGNGGVKRDPRIQDDAVLTAAWKDIRYVMKRVHERITWTDTLNFEEYTFDDGCVEDEYFFEGNHHFEARDLP